MRSAERHKISGIGPGGLCRYIFAATLILNLGSVFVHMQGGTWFIRTLEAVMGLSAVGAALSEGPIPRESVRRTLRVLALLVVFIGIYYIFDPLKTRTIIAYLMQLIAIAIYCLMGEKSLSDTLRCFTDIVIVIAAASLILWVAAGLLKLIKPTGYIYVLDAAGNAEKIPSYFGIYFETQTNNLFGLLSFKIRRNTAIFFEAPMASFVFTLAFLSEFLLSKDFRPLRLALLALAVLSTMSTTGLTALVISAAMKLFFTAPFPEALSKYKRVLTAAILILIIGVLSCLVLQKLHTSSGSARLDDFRAGFRAWLDKPIFGNGFNNGAAWQQYSEVAKGHQGFSDSPMLILTYGGIYLALPYLYAVCLGAAGIIRGRRIEKLIFYTVFLYMFILTVIPFQMLSFYLFTELAKEGSPEENAA